MSSYYPDVLEVEVEEEKLPPKKAKKPKKRKEKKAKKQRNRQLMLVLILLAFVLMLLVSIFVLMWKLWLEPAQNDVIQDDIRNVFSQAMENAGTESVPPTSSAGGEGTESGGEGPSSVPEETTPTGDGRDGLRRSEAVRYLQQNVNSDIVGWITVNGTRIDYPVLQSAAEDDEYFLNHNYLGQQSAYGSVFLDSYCDVDGGLQVLHGHNMDNGSMFHDLVNLTTPAAVAASPIIQYDTADEPSQWLIVSVIKLNTLPQQGEVFSYIRSGFHSPESKLEYIYGLMQRSIVNTHVGVNENDDLLLLSTCSYEFEEFRTLVVARRLRPGESVPAPYVTWAQYPLYPDCWYKKKGGSPFPWPDTFAEAKEQGLIDWYR